VRLGVRHALVGDRLVRGDVEVRDGVVTGVGLAPAGTGALAAPGFVDLQVNGFAGIDVLAASAEGLAAAGTALAATGVTAWLPTLITSPPAAYGPALGAVARAMGAPAGGARILGAHLEGPFLSPAWPGAHDPEHLREPDPALLGELLARAPVALVTLAPERPGARGLIAMLAARGIAISAGHSDADAAAAHAAFDAGVRAITHLHNGHRRVAHRDPGVGGVALVRDDVTVMAIPDGVHTAPEIVRAAQLAARERFCAVTDAMAGAGLGDGSFRLGGREVTVTRGAARLAGAESLAGSVLTLDAGVRNLVRWGASEVEALLAATRAPARLLARADIGVLAPGSPADVVVLDDRLEVRSTLVGGRVAG
jgi:N-acetylglucosamine-6-phosphate deacetylase